MSSAKLLLSGSLVACGLILGAFTLHGYFDPQWQQLQARAAKGARELPQETKSIGTFQGRAGLATTATAAPEDRPGVVKASAKPEAKPADAKAAAAKAAARRKLAEKRRAEKEAERRAKAKPPPPQQATFQWPWNWPGN